MSATPTNTTEPQKEGIKLTLNQLVLLTFGSVAVATLLVYVITSQLNKSK